MTYIVSQGDSHSSGRGMPLGWCTASPSTIPNARSPYHHLLACEDRTRQFRFSTRRVMPRGWSVNARKSSCRRYVARATLRPVEMDPGQLSVSTVTVRTLVAEQFPQWRHLRIEAVSSPGTVNAIFRIGDQFVARFLLIPDRQQFLAGVPAPARLMWNAVGGRVYEGYRVRIYGPRARPLADA